MSSLLHKVHNEIIRYAQVLNYNNLGKCYVRHNGDSNPSPLRFFYGAITIDYFSHQTPTMSADPLFLRAVAQLNISPAI